MLSTLQVMMNNAFNVIIDLSFNEIIYKFKIRDDFFELLFNDDELSSNIDLSAQRLKYRRKVVDVIVFVNVKFKIYYDVKHTSLLLNLDDCVYLRLHHEYQLLDKFNKKLS